jgi:hypothetical protein
VLEIEKELREAWALLKKEKIRWPLSVRLDPLIEMDSQDSVHCCHHHGAFFLYRLATRPMGYDTGERCATEEPSN